MRGGLPGGSGQLPEAGRRMSEQRLKPEVCPTGTHQPCQRGDGHAPLDGPAADPSTRPLEGDLVPDAPSRGSGTRSDALDRERNHPVREALVKWITEFRLPWSVFLTLTYAGDPPDRDRAEKDAYRFMARLERALGFAPPYVGCVEGEPPAVGEVGREPRTNIHFLIAGVEATKLGRLTDVRFAGMVDARPAQPYHLGYVAEYYPDHAILLMPRDFRHRVHQLRRREALQKKWARRRTVP